jgi:hypothetical protein
MRLALTLLMLPLLGFSQQPTEPSDPLVVVDSSAANGEEVDKEQPKDEVEIIPDIKLDEEIEIDQSPDFPYDI